MSGGWGCQHLSKTKECNSWCKLLKHLCEPGCKGCVLYNVGIFSEPNIPSEDIKKKKQRSDTPLK